MDYTAGKIFMGGGAGDGNNSAATGGAEGGGLVFILCHGSLVGSGDIIANGKNADNTTPNHNDAPGSGGGTIILSSSILQAL